MGTKKEKPWLLYKLRAEIDCDLITLLYRTRHRYLFLTDYETERVNCGVGVRAKICSQLTKEQILKVLEKIPDSHRIAETLELIGVAETSLGKLSAGEQFAEDLISYYSKDYELTNNNRRFVRKAIEEAISSTCELAVKTAVASIKAQRAKKEARDQLRRLKKEILSPFEEVADEIIKTNLGKRKLTKKDREFVRNIIADCLAEDPETEKLERFFQFAMTELDKNKLVA